MQIHQAVTMNEGMGVTVHRLFPIPQLRHWDPFVLWDHFDIPTGKGFPDHPHRGFEGISYLFQGQLQHQDNLGNNSTVSTGGAQCFTAGSGIVHSEMPLGRENTQGIQLWVNLKQQDKSLPPAYQQIDDGAFPLQERNGLTVKQIIGGDSPLQLHTAVIYQHIVASEDSAFDYQHQDHSGIAYLVCGRAELGGDAVNTGDIARELEPQQALLFEAGEALSLTLSAGSELMFAAGPAHQEPIIQHGPFVD